MGPQHARVLEWAKGYIKNLDNSERMIQDQEIIGAASLMWILIQSVVPHEISEHVMQCLENASLPALAT